MRNKYRWMACLLAITTITAGVSACGSNTTVTETAQESQEEAESGEVYGEVTTLDSTGITISLDASEGSESSESGEQQTFTITEDTLISGGNTAPGETPPEMPEGENGEEPPEMPEGESGEEHPEIPEGESGEEHPEMPERENGEEPPERPDGDDEEVPSEIPEGAEGEEAPEKPDEEDNPAVSQQLSLSDIAVGDRVKITYDENNQATEIIILGGDGEMGGGQVSAVDSYDSVEEYTEATEVSGETITSTGLDENAIHVAVTEALVTLDTVTVDRTSKDSTGGDTSSFYGVGAAILATEGTVEVENSTITTDAPGAAGIFAYGDGIVYTADTTITTQENTSGGIHVAGGGTLYAWDMTVETNGESSAAIRSDRGSGTMVVEGGTYTSNGTGSPAVYSTADITIKDGDLKATGSEAVCIEGLNALRLYNSNLTGNMSDLEQNDCTWNVILYQSMSGDSEVGESVFEMSGGTLTAQNGGMFYTTNTESSFVLENVDITYAEENDFFLRCTGNSNERGWGKSGANGADSTFTAISQDMVGDVIWDSISELEFYMTEGSTLTGAIIQDETHAGNGGDGGADVTIDDTSTWIVTGDSTLSSLENAGTIVDENGQTVSILGTDGTVYVEGNSSLTVTVYEYETNSDLSEAGSIADWSNYEVEDFRE